MRCWKFRATLSASDALMQAPSSRATTFLLLKKDSGKAKAVAASEAVAMMLKERMLIDLVVVGWCLVVELERGATAMGGIRECKRF